MDWSWNQNVSNDPSYPPMMQVPVTQPVVHQQPNETEVKLNLALQKIQMLENVVVGLRSRVDDLERMVGSQSEVRTSNLGKLSSGKTYYLVNAGTNTCLDNMGHNRNGGGIHNWQFVRNNRNQGWMLEQIDHETWSLVSCWTGRALDMTGHSRNDGKIHCWKFDRNNRNQHVKIVRADRESFYLIFKNGGRAIDLSCGNAKNGNKIIQWEHVQQNPNQKWKFLPYPNATPQRQVIIPSPQHQGGNIVSGKTYYLVNVQTNTTLDNMGQNKNGGGVHNWEFMTGNKNQGWIAQQINHDTWALINCWTKRALDMTGHSKQGGKIHCWSFDKNNRNQHIQIVRADHQSYHLVFKNGGRAVNLHSGNSGKQAKGGNLMNGNMIVQWSLHKGNLQKWKFVEYPEGSPF